MTIAGTSGAASDGIRIDGGSAATFSFGGDHGRHHRRRGHRAQRRQRRRHLLKHHGQRLDRPGDRDHQRHQCGQHQRRLDRQHQRSGRHRRRHQRRHRQRHHRRHRQQDDRGRRGRGAGPHRRHGRLQRQHHLERNGGGIDLTGNTGGTVRFDGGMNLSTGATTAFNCHGGSTGATLVVTDTVSTSNILTTTTGTALNVANTTIGAEDLTFQSIGRTAAARPASFSTRPARPAACIVTGTGTAGSGGTIANKTGADGSTTTGDRNLPEQYRRRAARPDAAQRLQNFAIRGNNVTDFSFDNSVINGDQRHDRRRSDEAAISFNHLLGSANISNSQHRTGSNDIAKVLNSSGTLNRLTISTTPISAPTTRPWVAMRLQIVASQTATVNVTVDTTAASPAHEAICSTPSRRSRRYGRVFRDNTRAAIITPRCRAASNILVFSTGNGDRHLRHFGQDINTAPAVRRSIAANGVPVLAPAAS